LGVVDLGFVDLDFVDLSFVDSGVVWDFDFGLVSGVVSLCSEVASVFGFASDLDLFFVSIDLGLVGLVLE